MKRVIYIIFLLLIQLQPDAFGQSGKEWFRIKPDSVSSDSTKYELIVIDPGFETWLLTKPPVNYCSQQYYELKNRFFVLEWNYRYMHPLRYGSLYDTWIDYDPLVDYGLDLNYRLYYYFLFFQERNHVNLLGR
ncbi:MAG: DUF6146 family protein [Bacteroidales bacterium]|jgi:hypothetical protein